MIKVREWGPIYDDKWGEVLSSVLASLSEDYERLLAWEVGQGRFISGGGDFYEPPRYRSSGE